MAEQQNDLGSEDMGSKPTLGLLSYMILSLHSHIYKMGAGDDGNNSNNIKYAPYLLGWSGSSKQTKIHVVCCKILNELLLVGRGKEKEYSAIKKHYLK